MRTAFITTVLLSLATPYALAQSIEALETQLDKARDSAPMVVKPFLPVNQPAKHFGDYDARPPKAYSRGEKMHFYAEPKNLVQAKKTGTFEPALEIDSAVVPEKGETLKQPKFMSMRIPSRSRINDLFVNLSVSLGSAPPGKYVLKFVFRDLNSPKVATVEQEVTIR
jgi:hypothetical protein